MKHSRRQRITLKDLYIGYTHKTYDTTSNTVPDPYFPKTEISDHAFAMTYIEWATAVRIYHDLLLDYLLTTGKSFKLRSNLGFLQIMKYKPIKHPKVDAKASKEQGREVLFKNNHTQGWSPYVKWLKLYKDGVRLKYKLHWKITFTKKAWSKVSKYIMEDFTRINKYNKLT